jgi:hypothetical protein
MLKAALAELVDVGLLTTWALDDRDLVTVEKVPTLSQAKHLAKKVIRN